MRQLTLFLALSLIVGCQTTASSKKVIDPLSGAPVLRMGDSAPVIKAVVENPYPRCKKTITTARLDKSPAQKVYVDLNNGEVCQ